MSALRPAHRTGTAQFPTMRGGGRSADDFVEYLSAWCVSDNAVSEVTSSSSTAAPPRCTGVAYLNSAFLSRDDQNAATSVHWGGRGSAQSGAASTAPPHAAMLYPSVCDAALFATGGWDEAIYDAIQWLAEGASHQSIRHSALASTGSCQYAMDAVLSEAFTTTEDSANELLQRLALDTFSGSLVLLCFHPHASIGLWARQTLLNLIQNAAWTQAMPHENGATHHADGQGTPQKPSKELARLLALWMFALNFMSTIKHMQAVRFVFEQAPPKDGGTAGPARISLDKERVRSVVRGFYHLLVVLTQLDLKLTAATEALRNADHSTTMRTASTNAPPSVPTTHATTPLLLAGSLLCYWFLAAFDVLVREATGRLRARASEQRERARAMESQEGGEEGLERDDPDTHSQRGEEETDGTCEHDMDSASRSVLPVRVDRVSQRTMHLMVGFLNDHLRRDATLSPPSLAVDIKKALVKVLVHSLLDNARGAPKRKEDVDWRLQRMQRLWLFAFQLDPPTSVVTVKKDTTAAAHVPVHNVTEWMLRALLRNAAIQLRFEEAVAEAKTKPRVHPPGVLPSPADATEDAPALPDAVFALYALLFTLEKAAPPAFLASAFFHDVLLEYEQTLFAITVGGVVQLYSSHAVELYAFLLRADVHYFFPVTSHTSTSSAPSPQPAPHEGGGNGSTHTTSATQASALLAAAHARSAQEPRTSVALQRCWSNFAVLMKQMIKVEAPGELFTSLMEALAPLVAHPPCCLWLLTTADLANSKAPFGWHVKHLLGSAAEVLQTSGRAVQELWQSTDSTVTGTRRMTSANVPATAPSGDGRGQSGTVSARSRETEASVVFIAAAASSVRSVSAVGTGARVPRSEVGGSRDGLYRSGDVVTATSRLLAMHPLFARLVQTLELGEDRVLDGVARGLSSVFLSAVNESVLGGFTADAAAWVLLHAVIPQSALSGDHFLRMSEASVNNVARTQAGLWVRVLTRCNWRSLSPLFALVAWWLCALLIDVATLAPDDRQALLDKVVTQLPALITSTSSSSAFTPELAARGRTDPNEGEHTEDASMETHASLANRPTDGSSRAELAQQVQVCREAMFAGSTEDPPLLYVQAMRASPFLYEVLCQMLLNLLKGHSQYRVDTFTGTLLYIAGALPARRVSADMKFTAALQKALVTVCGQLAARDMDTLKQYAPAWLADGLRRAGQTIDECLAEQDRRFAQFEWEEKQLAQASAEQQRRDTEDRATAQRNVETLHQQAVRDRAAGISHSGQDSPAPTGSGAMTSLTALALGVKREREEDSTTPLPSDEGELGGWRRAKRQRDALEERVAALLGQPCKSDARKEKPATPSAVTSVAAAPVKQPTVLQQRLQAVNAQHAQHAQHVQNQGDLEAILRRVAATTNLAMKPPYTGDIIGSAPSCIAPEVPVLPSVFAADGVASANGTTTAAARSIQQWAATGRLYANSFAPHIALELRFDIMRAFDEWLDQCRVSGFDQDVSNTISGAPGSRCAMLSTSRQRTVADRFPLNMQVEADGSAVVMAPSTVSLVDALNPMEITFTVQSIDLGTGRYRANSNNGANGGRGGKGRSRGYAGALPLYAEFAEGDVVLALLPLASLLPQWLAYQRTRSTADGVAYTVADQEALLAAIPPMWSLLGCLPQVCYIKSLLYGQRTATLATYPSSVPSQGEAGASYGNPSHSAAAMAAAAAVAATRISFQHALHVAFKEGTQSAFYLYKLSSLGQAFTSVNALHRIHETCFAQTLYDPRRSAAESERFFRNVHKLCVVKRALPALRARMVLQSTLNSWQAQAVLAVLYAATPSWDRAAPLDTSVRGYDKASIDAIATSPITMVNDATSQLFFGTSGQESAATSSASSAHTSVTDSGGGSFASARATALFQGSRIPDVLLIEGPPGTGKTQTIAVLVLNLLLHLPPKSRVLLCAPSNCAVDEALLRVQRLQHRLAARHAPMVSSSGTRPLNVSTVTKGSLLRVGVRASVDEAVLRAMPPVFLDDLVDQAVAAQEKASKPHGDPYSNASNRHNNSMNGNNDANSRTAFNRRTTAKERLLRDAVVVFSTLGSLSHVQRSGLQFDVVVVDEASQGTEPDVLQALMLAKKKVVLVGDSKQLQPTILCKEAARCGLRRSLLVRLLQNAHRSFLLRTQYRMHPDICAFPNGYFYGAKLCTDQSVLARIQGPASASNDQRRGASRPSPSPARTVGQKLGHLPRFVFLNVADGVMAGGRGHSLRNQREAHAVVQHMRQLRSFLRLTVQEFGQHAGIITYYSAQRDTIRHLLSPDERNSGLQIATVDSFQGKEKEIIFISCVRALTREQVQHLECVLADRGGRRVPGAATATGVKRECDGRGEDDQGARPRADEAMPDEARPLFQAVREEDVDGVDLDDMNPASRQQALHAPQGTHHRATLGFLSDWHRINVSLTRARELCLVYGHQPTIELAAALAPPPQPPAVHLPGSAGASAPQDREALLRELEAADEDPQLLSEMIAHARQPNVTSARLAEQERSGRLSLGALPNDAAVTTTGPSGAKKEPSSADVIDVDDDGDEMGQGGGVPAAPASLSSLVPGFTVVGSHSRNDDESVVAPSQPCRAACLVYELRDNLIEILASYRS